MTEYITYEEATARTGFTYHVIRDWVKKGHLEPVKIGQKHFVIFDELMDAAELHDPRGDLCFIDDYNHLRDFDFSHARIAERLNATTRAIVNRAIKLGIYRPERYEREALKVLDRLIDSGGQFTSEMLPCTFDESLGAALTARARAAGRVRVVGSRTSQVLRTGIKVNVYEGVAA